MNFTQKTYRAAIKRSIEAEQRWWQISKVASGQQLEDWLPSYMAYHKQTLHTRKLQARKRRERK